MQIIPTPDGLSFNSDRLRNFSHFLHLLCSTISKEPPDDFRVTHNIYYTDTVYPTMSVFSLNLDTKPYKYQIVEYHQKSKLKTMSS
jgi:hypothetical protein